MTNEVATQSKRGVSLGQRRANHAWQRVTDLKKSFAEAAVKDYAIEAKKLPIRIRASGLGQALAFIASKAKKSTKNGQALERLLLDLSDWTLRSRGVPWTPGDPTDTAPPPDKLLPCIVKGTTGFLRWSTDEVLSYLQWLNRFLDAEVDADPTET